MVVRSYRTYWYCPFFILYLGYALALIAANRKAFVVLQREHASLAVFMALYAVVYLPAAAFDNSVSATGTTRCITCHLAPLFFVIAYVSAREPFPRTKGRVGALAHAPARRPDRLGGAGPESRVRRVAPSDDDLRRFPGPVS